MTRAGGRRYAASAVSPDRCPGAGARASHHAAIGGPHDAGSRSPREMHGAKRFVAAVHPSPDRLQNRLQEPGRRRGNSVDWRGLRARPKAPRSSNLSDEKRAASPSYEMPPAKVRNLSGLQENWWVGPSPPVPGAPLEGWEYRSEHHFSRGRRDSLVRARLVVEADVLGQHTRICSHDGHGADACRASARPRTCSPQRPRRG